MKLNRILSSAARPIHFRQAPQRWWSKTCFISMIGLPVRRLVSDGEFSISNFPLPKENHSRIGQTLFYNLNPIPLLFRTRVGWVGGVVSSRYRERHDEKVVRRFCFNHGENLINSIDPSNHRTNPPWNELMPAPISKANRIRPCENVYPLLGRNLLVLVGRALVFRRFHISWICTEWIWRLPF